MTTGRRIKETKEVSAARNSSGEGREEPSRDTENRKSRKREREGEDRVYAGITRSRGFSNARADLGRSSDRRMRACARAQRIDRSKSERLLDRDGIYCKTITDLRVATR